MSIALSATILPSRYLMLTTAAMALFAVSAAAYCLWSLRLPSYLQITLMAIFCGFISYQFSTFRLKRRAVKLDISASGQIIVRKFSISTAQGLTHVATLDEASTLWPYLLMLHLRLDDGSLLILPVLPDSVDSRTWRALSVALRWIVIHQLK